MNLQDPCAEIRKGPQGSKTNRQGIKDWLDKYRDLYDYVENSLSCRENGNSCVMGVLEDCKHSNYKSDCKFADIYKDLEEWYNLVEDQEKYKKILEEYEEVKHSKLAVIKWAIKYEALGEETYIDRLHFINIDLYDVRYSEAFKEHYWNSAWYVAKYKGEI